MIRYFSTIFILDDKPKPPPNEPAAPIPKDTNSIEEDMPWRRLNTQRNQRSQQDSPPKNRNKIILFCCCC